MSRDRVEQRGDLEPFLAEARVVGERQAEVAGAHDRDAHALVEPENLPQVAAQLLDVVADAADAELAEIGEVLADLRRVEVELLGQRLRRDRPDAGRVERVEAAQVDRQPVGRQLGNRLDACRAPARSCAWLQRVAPRDASAASRPARDRWLVLVSSQASRFVAPFDASGRCHARTA